MTILSSVTPWTLCTVQPDTSVNQKCVLLMTGDVSLFDSIPMAALEL